LPYRQVTLIAPGENRSIVTSTNRNHGYLS